ncbi:MULTISPECIES: glycerate kinase [unclassified Microbacterium]|uniref:glycerate kinase n=1 Tax=unclassified Microbacterium TaxID=2609290 RepID=UPI0022ABCDB0|nr:MULTISPECIES: glycerate kinase [unclassified Microbacterium]
MGPRGAAAVFGSQKGPNSVADITRVDSGLQRLADVLGLDATQSGTGAAGGPGGALDVWGGVLAPGATEGAELIGVADAIADADVVITGEGSYDGQSNDGKVPSFLAGLAADAGARAMLAAGLITSEADLSLFAASASLTDLAGSSDAALAEPACWSRVAGAELARSAARQN